MADPQITVRGRSMLTPDQAFDTALAMYRESGVMIDTVDRQEGLISGRLVSGPDQFRINVEVQEIKDR